MRENNIIDFAKISPEENEDAYFEVQELLRLSAEQMELENELNEIHDSQNLSTHCSITQEQG
jgi:hypothetical protein